jgi:hypothetical protein
LTYLPPFGYIRRQTYNQKGIHKMQKLVGLMGAAGAGKSTVAQALVDLNTGWKLFNFADRLKEITSVIFDIPLEHMNNFEEKEKERDCIIIDNYVDAMSYLFELDIQRHGMIASSYRQLLQYIGSEYVRSVDDTYWVDYILKRQAPLYEKVVVGDCRFENEIAAIKNINGTVFSIEREDVTFTDSHASARDLRHLADMRLIFPVGGLAEIAEWAKLYDETIYH